MPDLFDTADPIFGLPALLSLLFALLSLFAFLLHLRHRRPLRAGMQGLLALGLFGLALVLFLAGINLYTYQRLTHEAPLAQLRFEQLGPQRYLARIQYTNRAGEHRYALSGDEWQLDARVLRWQPPATLLGLDSRYRLERLSGRYTDIRQQRERPQSVYALTDQKGMEIWSLLGKLQDYIGWVDTYFGSASYLPMADKAAYEVVLTQSGLVARPLNRAARLAVQGW